MRKWFLEYTGFDSLENEITKARTLVQKGLESTSEETALKEGKRLWAEISKVKYTGWDKQKYPNSPCIVFRILLK